MMPPCVFVALPQCPPGEERAESLSYDLQTRPSGRCVRKCCITGVTSRGNRTFKASHRATKEHLVEIKNHLRDTSRHISPQRAFIIVACRRVWAGPCHVASGGSVKL